MYILEKNTERFLCEIKKYENFSLIYFNIRSTSSTSEKLHNFLVKCSNFFNISSVAETNSFNITCVEKHGLKTRISKTIQTFI